MGTVNRSQFTVDLERPLAMRRTDRDTDILVDIDRHKWLTAEQIFSLNCTNESNAQRLRRRLQRLFQNEYVYRIEAPLWRPRIYKITSKAMRAIAAQRGVVARRVTPPGDVNHSREHQIGLSDFTVTLDRSVRQIAGARLIDEASIYATAPDDVRRQKGWRVSVSYGVDTHTVRIRPDHFLAVEFDRRPPGHNRRYFIIEYDRGTMTIRGRDLAASSCTRKFLAYAASIEQRAHKANFGIEHAYVLFVTKSRARRDGLVAEAARVLGNRPATDMMLFAVRPEPPTITRATDIAAMDWVTARGKPVPFPL